MSPRLPRSTESAGHRSSDAKSAKVVPTVPRAVESQSTAAGKLKGVRLADVEREVGAVSAAEIVLLEIVAEAGGEIVLEHLEALITQRLPSASARVETLLARLEARSLTVRLRYTMPGRRDVSVNTAALLLPGATGVATRVCGVSLPAVPSPDTPATQTAPPDVSVRDRAALLGALLHTKVRYTTTGLPHRSSVRTLAKKVGRTEDWVEGELSAAGHRGLLALDGERLTPVPSAIRADLDKPRFSWRDRLSFATQWVPADRWTALDALVRAIVRKDLDDFNWKTEYRPNIAPRGGPKEHAAAREAVLTRGGLDVLTCDGTVFVRRVGPRPGAAMHGDGHVTPNFDVILGPAASPALALAVSLGAEPVRFDRALTFKLTPASVANVAVMGEGTDAFLAALDAVGPHGVADNVRTLVTEWISRTVVARATRGWLVEVPSGSIAKCEKNLGKSVLRRVGASALLIAAATPPAVIAKALESAGVRASIPLSLREAAFALRGMIDPSLSDRTHSTARRGGASDPFDGFDESDEFDEFDEFDESDDHDENDPFTREFDRSSGGPRDNESLPACPLPLHPTPDARLREKYVRARSAVPQSGPPDDGAADAVKPPTDAETRATMALLDGVLAQLSSEVATDWHAFLARLPTEDRERLPPLPRALLIVLPWAALSRKWRRRAAFDASSVGELLQRAVRMARDERITVVGLEALRLATRPDIRAHLNPATQAGSSDTPAVRPPDEPTAASPDEPTAASPDEPTAASPTREVLKTVSQPTEIVEAFERAIADGVEVGLEMHGDAVSTLCVVRGERVVTTGTEVRLLATDADSEEGRSFPLAKIRMLTVFKHCSP